MKIGYKELLLTLDDAAVPAGDPLDGAAGRLDVEGARGPHRDAPGMDALPAEDKDAAFAALVVASVSPVTPTGAGLPSYSLTIRITTRPVSCLTWRVC